MSVQTMSWVFDHSPVEGAARLVLLSLANHASADGSDSYPSVETIRREARLKSRRTVQNALRSLVESKAIQIDEEPGPKGQGRYRVLSSNAPAQELRSASDDAGGAHLTTPGGASDDSRVKGTVLTKPSKEEPSNVREVWAYWLEITGKKQCLDDKRKRIIRNAIRIAGIDATKQALLGLSRSPHHQGQNEQRREYMEIRYALKGRGDESDDERIEKAITWAATHSPQQNHVDPDKVDRWLDQVRYHKGKLAGGSRDGRQLAIEAYRKLVAAGFTVVSLDKPPWARLQR